MAFQTKLKMGLMKMITMMDEMIELMIPIFSDLLSICVSGS
jgi:hypothetical protein